MVFLPVAMIAVADPAPADPADTIPAVPVPVLLILLDPRLRRMIFLCALLPLTTEPL